MAMQDALLEFAAEETLMSPRTSATSSMPRFAPALIGTRNNEIDATSRAISFMLGFALASVLAALVSLVAGDTTREASDPAAATKVESVAPAVEPVVTVATPAAPVARSAIATSATAVAPRTAPMVKRAPPLNAVPAPRTPAQRQPVVSGYVGALAVSSAPEGAQVWINGRAAGQTPIVLDELPAGSRAIVLRLDGYSPWSSSVRVVAGQRLPVRVTLKPTH